jgi:hypothetical protein
MTAHQKPNLGVVTISQLVNGIRFPFLINLEAFSNSLCRGPCISRAVQREAPCSRRKQDKNCFLFVFEARAAVISEPLDLIRYFTSGTTGKPKAVAIPHHAVIANVIQNAAFTRLNDPILSRNAARYRKGDVNLGVLPMFRASRNTSCY